ncbi:T9SS type A sorting domain-containing protein [Fluviicola taffensis]|uniref:Secretion system C-terminal sorting domain-containing protein n=1 Tax=Fluviicola taffensis (strain DSM 16823 / NCIMB 13979 / RW262) TaxID=755732 RepID=F2IEH4_FLUTR|nr:T9SS type A sorting domain-containing protein [Fluviicola taffensis]AEA43498.1 hypothetical protein Fluta_1504 [Fluviicola taffensis DSM 16823]
MKKLLTLFVVFISTFSFSQSWNFIGSSTGIATASEVDIEISTSGVLFAAYIDGSNSNKITVRKWNNGAWQLVGTAGISSPNASAIRLILYNETPIVAAKIDDTYDRIECHRFNGTTWTTLFNNYIQINAVTYISKDFDISCNSVGDVFLTYYNPDYQTFSHEGLITLKSGSPTIIGAVNIDENSEYLSAVSCVATTGNNVLSLFEADMDMDYGINISTISTSTYSNDTYEYGTDAKKIILEKGLNSSLYSCSHMTDQYNQRTLAYRAFNGVSTLGTPLNIVSSSPNLVDYDLVTDGTTGYVFYRNGTTNFFRSFTAGLTPGTLSTITSGATLAPTDATSHSAETYNGIHVIAYISGGKFYVKEYNQAANIEDYDYFAMCEGTAFNNSASNSIYLLDPNYSQANLGMTVTSQNVSVIPNSAVSVSGSGLNYSVFITNTNDVTSPTTVDLQFILVENGVNVDTLLIPIVVNPKPIIAFNNTTSSICENANPVNLNPIASPTGGSWSGNGVVNNTFYPSYPTGSTVVLTYSKTNQYGCTSSGNTQVTINQTPDLNVTTNTSNCNQNTGTASVAITNGLSPYAIYWSTGSTLSSVSNLSSGQYLVSVTDANGCLSTSTAMVGSNGLSQTGITTGASCYGSTNGAINVTVSGGVAPLVYAWSSGATTEDITGCVGGPYELTITDASGCVSTATYVVQEPQQIMLNQMTVTQPACSATNGQAVASFNGGTAPFTYAWTNAVGTAIGGNSGTLTNIGAGTFTCTLTDVNGCTFSTSALVSNNFGPTLAIDTIIDASCSNNGQIQLTVISGNPTAYLWTNGAITQNITNLSPGNYSVSVAGASGCITVLGGTVGSTLPDPVELCLVTVDSVTNTNLVVWEKPISSSIDHFNIYRETSQAGLYQLVGTVNYTDESVYNDLVASPNVRSWRYKISSVDACGTESAMSLNHKTIHLVISHGLGNDINLFWDGYEGFSYPNFVLKRHTNADGWTTLTTMPNNLFTYTDQPNSTDGLYYVVTVNAPSICNATKAAQDFNTTRSNRDNRLSTGQVNSISELIDQAISIYPNPTNSILHVDNTSNQLINAQILDQAGRIISIVTIVPGQTKIDCGKLAGGMYSLELLSQGAKTLKRFVIEK